MKKSYTRVNITVEFECRPMPFAWFRKIFDKQDAGDAHPGNNYGSTYHIAIGADRHKQHSQKRPEREGQNRAAAEYTYSQTLVSGWNNAGNDCAQRRCGNAGEYAHDEALPEQRLPGMDAKKRSHGQGITA